MCAHILSGQGQSSDMDLLQEFSGMLHVITSSRDEKSYNRRLYQLTLVTIDVMTAKESQYKRRRVGLNLERPTAIRLPSSDRTALRITTSDAFPSSNSNHSHSTPAALEDKDQNFDYAGFLDSDDPFSFVKSIVPMNSGSGQSSAHETNPNMGSYAKALFEDFDSLGYSLESSTEDFGEREM